MQLIYLGGLGKTLMRLSKEKDRIEKRDLIVIDNECEECKKYGAKLIKPEEGFEFEEGALVAGGSGSVSSAAFKRIITQYGDKLNYFVVLPFKFEGKRRAENAKEIVRLLKGRRHYIYDNQKLVHTLAPGVGMKEGLEMVVLDYDKFLRKIR